MIRLRRVARLRGVLGRGVLRAVLPREELRVARRVSQGLRRVSRVVMEMGKQRRMMEPGAWGSGRR
jgi:hypothetical protein